jgi:hypothetical protein
MFKNVTRTQNVIHQETKTKTTALGINPVPQEFSAGLSGGSTLDRDWYVRIKQAPVNTNKKEWVYLLF